MRYWMDGPTPSPSSWHGTATSSSGSRCGCSDADDALQSAFVRAYRSLGRCREPERFGAWLRQIVVNECRTLGTARGRREVRLVRDEVVLERLEGTEIEEGGMDLELVRRALERLTPDEWEQGGGPASRQPPELEP